MLVFALFCLLSVYLLCLLCGRKRREGEPPLIKGWIPVLGKAVEFGKDAHKFLVEYKDKYGDIFTVKIAGKYMTFIMNPLLYPSIIKHGRQLDFHQFSDQVAPVTFGYPPILSGQFPGMHEQIQRSFRLLQGDNLTALTETMMSNLLLLLRQEYLGRGEVGWARDKMYEFCSVVMFEATFLTIYGRPAEGRRHHDMSALRHDFLKFDQMFPLLIARIPIWLLGQTSAIRQKLIHYFLPQRMSCWVHTSQFIKTRCQVFEQYEVLGDADKAAHHFAILWASVGNTIPATFWALYYLLNDSAALQAVRRELLSVLQLSGDEDLRQQDIMLSRDQLNQLLYMESAISESLRLSSASMNLRMVQEDFVLSLETERSVGVRKGDLIALYPQSMHLDPEIYPDPQVYKYDRYMEDGREKTDFYKDGQRLKYYRMPFGSGSTMCPGRHFALNEIKQFLCLLLLYFELELDQSHTKITLDSSRAGLGILLPANDVCFRYRPRTIPGTVQATGISSSL